MSLYRKIADRSACLRHAVLMCCFVFAIGIPAQAPHSDVRDSLASPYRIAGVLVNAATGDPVPRATIQALTVEDRRAVASGTTDSEGRFTLDHLAAAKYQLVASKRGFRTAAYDEHDEFSSAIVTGPDQDTAHLNFKLMPNAILRGVVTDDAGEPVANARVMLYRRPKHPAVGNRIVQTDGTETDDTGAYEIGNLPVGEYLLAVMAEPWYAIHDRIGSNDNPALDVVYPVTYFDSTTNEASATPIVLAGGEHGEANISLHAVPALHVSVTAPRRSNGEFGNAEMQQIVFGNIVSGADNYNYFAQSGLLTINGLVPGNYQLVLRGDSERILGVDLSSNQQLDPNAGASLNSLQGRVRTISRTEIPEQITLSLQRLDNGPGQSEYAAEAHSGHFRFDAIPPGQWTVWATSGDQALPVLAVSTGGAPRAGNVLSLGDHISPLTILLSTANSRIEGFAKKDGRGFAGAMIVLLPRNPAQWNALTRRDQSDSDGSFTLRDVAPGQYTLIAIKDGWPLDWTSPAAMARFLPGGTNVTVTENSGKLLQLRSPVTVQDR